MSDTVTAVYERGVFRPESPCDLPEGSRVVLAIQDATRTPLSEEEKRRMIEQLIERMKRNPLPPDAPRSKRDEFMTAVDTNVLIYVHDVRDPEVLGQPGSWQGEKRRRQDRRRQVR